MKKTFKRVAAPLLIVLIGTILTAKANAECLSYLPGHKGAVLSPQSWSGAQFNSASLLLVSDHNDDDPIVGFWKVAFTSKGNEPNIPDGAPIDSGFVQWHSDGTEIMNSGRPPQNGNICMGVWERTGRSRYKLNHFANGNDKGTIRDAVRHSPILSDVRRHRSVSIDYISLLPVTAAV